MAWADSGSEAFVISQLGYTRGIIATLRETLGPQALPTRTTCCCDAQAELGLKVATGAASSFMQRRHQRPHELRREAGGQQRDHRRRLHDRQGLPARVRVGTVPSPTTAAPGMRYVVRGTTYKPRDHDASMRFKRAR